MLVHQIGKRLGSLIHIAPGMSMIWPGRAQDDELLRMRHRQVAQQDLIGQREDGGVGADAQGESENGDGGEARRFSEHAKSEAQILEQGVEEGKATAVAVALPGLFETAELEERLAAGLFGGHALSEVAFDSHFQVRTQFGVEVAIELRAAKDGAQAVKRLAKPGDHWSRLR